ncbi:hypothetical protein N3K66_008167 [Trichothecium roseum]|uniref:Uncharacterized protein n=1 Tax=Trichothecium roseum TaxID=47278 RepID=A0ACC0USU2_9HYPO|nr:hypothetical protein N3K66_008167 [Trichothecium roseum]
MEYSPRERTQSSNQTGQPLPSQQRNMAMLTATATSHSFQRDHYWAGANARSPPYRPSGDNDSSKSSISLPSIRLTFPELQLPSTSQDTTKPHSSSTSPRSTAPGGQLTSPDYVYSPGISKRRRSPLEDEQERERARQVPRLYGSPEEPRRLSPERPAAARHDSWSYPSRRSPLPSHENTHPVPMEVKDVSGPRHSLPSLAPPSLGARERHGMPQLPTREYRNDESYPDPRVPPQPPAHHHQPHHQHYPAEASTPRYPSDYSYRPAPSAPPPPPAPPAPAANHHGSPYDRAPYMASSRQEPPHHQPSHPVNPYTAYDTYCARFPDLSMTVDTKQRKRRGNLPKETTDKLRAWFMAHLAHPYPTEDEKQELMRQTGLQMNQISNWFINARRRQLPTMINNARVETDATSSAPASRSADGSAPNMPPTAERPDYLHHARPPPPPPLHHHHPAPHHYHDHRQETFSSDGDASFRGGARGYDDDMERRVSTKRGSI